jgi:hypothetical protein
LCKAALQNEAADRHRRLLPNSWHRRSSLATLATACATRAGHIVRPNSCSTAQRAPPLRLCAPAAMWQDFRAPLHSTARESVCRIDRSIRGGEAKLVLLAPVLRFTRFARRCSYGCAVDLWAIGCVLYELFSLKQLFRYVSTCRVSCRAHAARSAGGSYRVRFGAQLRSAYLRARPI